MGDGVPNDSELSFAIMNAHMANATNVYNDNKRANLNMATTFSLKI
jgi:hypothetical protein